MVLFIRALEVLLVRGCFEESPNDFGSVFFGGAYYRWPERVVVLGLPVWWKEANRVFNGGIKRNLVEMLATRCLGVNRPVCL